MTPLLIVVLRDPAQLAKLTPAQCDLLLRQADRAQLLASLYARAQHAGILEHMPACARRQLEWAQQQGARHLQAVRWEVRQIRQAMAGLGVPLILLKGGAYAMAGLAAGEGRIFSDIDILVPRQSLADVESALMLHGWAGTGLDTYDEHYYRRWMHELPPMRHLWRETTIDVHHAILPPTATAQPDPMLLRAAAEPLPTPAPDASGLLPPLYTLSQEDMVLHCATHLLYEGEFEHGLRNLVDLDRLLHQFASDAAFWTRLQDRAAALELERPLFYALRHAARLLHTPVPSSVLDSDAGRPGPLQLALMDQLLDQALLPSHPSCHGVRNALARQMLYMRGNWLRMPPWMLLRHLCHKALLTPLQAARTRSI
jgi:hypothetical protein